LALVLLLVDGLEDIFKATIVPLEDGVFCAHVERVVSLEGKLEAGMGELGNGFVGVIHAEHHTGVFEMEDFMDNGFTAIIWDERHQEFASLLWAEVGSSVLVSESVSSNYNWFSPAGNKSWNVFDNDWLTEDSSAKNVSNSSVWRFPHLLELKLLDASLIGCNGGAFDANSALLDRHSSINSDLVIGSISVLNAEIKVLDV
jgi:hypothetical protein